MNEAEVMYKEYDDFMNWFEKTYPELFEKYARNVTTPMTPGGGVCVNNDYKITEEEFSKIKEIARLYYHPEG